MRILYQSPSLIPSQTANSVHVMNISDEFSKMGHNVKLIVFRGGLDNSGDDYQYYGVDNCFEIIKISYDGKLGKIVFLIYSLIEAIKFRPNLIVTRFPLGAYLSALFGFQVVLDAHHPVWRGNLFKRIAYRGFKNNKNIVRVTTNSRELQNIFYEARMKPKCEVVVAHNGSKLFSLEHKFNIKSQDVLNVGYIGSVYKGRGIDLIIQIAEKLLECNFHIAGGSVREVEEIQATYKVPSNVYFYGYIDPSKAYMFRNSCDVLIAPYHRKGVLVSDGKEDSSQYMNPIKIIEYMSSGKAIIASDLPPIREILNDEIAILANPDQVDEWVDAIARLRSNTKRRLDMGKKSYEYFVNKLTWKARARKLIDGLPI